MHASHRGDDILSHIRMVLSTVSTRLLKDVSLRFELMKKSPEEIVLCFIKPLTREAVTQFVRQLATYCGGISAG
jgi:hypothetical protein